MKQLIIILMGLVLWQASVVCAGNGHIAEADRQTEVENRATPSNQSWEEQTGVDFYRFALEVWVTCPSREPEELVCTEYKGTTELFNRLINLIHPAPERLQFSKTQHYKTHLMEAEYTEYTEVAEDGSFARLELEFKNRQVKKYTITFKRCQ